MGDAALQLGRPGLAILSCTSDASDVRVLLMQRRPGILVNLVAMMVVGCGDPAATNDTASSSDCTQSEIAVNWENWGAGFFADYCRTCHSVGAIDRHEAPEGVDFDTLQQAIEWRDRVEARVLGDATMPPGGGILPEDLETLAIFLECGL